MKPVLLVVLQCPWRKGPLANGWNSRVWVKMLWLSHTGKRLREALPLEFYEVKVCNANPSLADSPDGGFPPDLRHLRRVLGRVQPDVVLACGKVAQGAIAQIAPAITTVEMSHPAHRLLSKQTTAEIKARLVALAIKTF